jgi:hypothetical protein
MLFVATVPPEFPEAAKRLIVFYSKSKSMRKRYQPSPDAIVPEKLMELAKKSVETDRPVRPNKICGVCGSSYAPTSGPQQPEDLCWVCRRLKISAWRDADQQSAAQE